MAVYSHIVLRLLPHHVDLNPVELIWAYVKQWLRADNTTFHINDKHICEQGFKETRAVEWNSICEHVEKLEKRYYKEEDVMENMIGMIIVSDSGMGSSSSSLETVNVMNVEVKYQEQRSGRQLVLYRCADKSLARSTS